MSYSALVTNENYPAVYLCVIQGRYPLFAKAATYPTYSDGTYPPPDDDAYNGWEAVATYTNTKLWRQPFRNIGRPVKVEVDGTEWTQVFTYTDITTDSGPILYVDGVAVQAGVDLWYFDETTQDIYLIDGPNTFTPVTKQVVVTFECYFATSDVNFHRVPTDNTTRQVAYAGTVIRIPEVTVETSDFLYGVSPTYSTNMELTNSDRDWEKRIHRGNFEGGAIKVYRVIDNIDDGNAQRVFTGYTQQLSLGSNRVSVRMADSTQILNQDFRPLALSTTSDSYDTTGADPKFAEKNLRSYWGYCDLKRFPIYTGYLQETPTVSDNRYHIIGKRYTQRTALPGAVVNMGTLWTTASGAHTTTTTTVTNAAGFMIDDMIHASSTRITDYENEGTTINNSYLARVTDVTGNVITHTAWETNTGAAGSAVVNGNHIYRKWYQPKYYASENQYFYFIPHKKYQNDLTHDSGNRTGFQLETTYEAALSVSAYNPLNDFVFGKVYGPKAKFVEDLTEKYLCTIGGAQFGSDSANYGCCTNPVVLIYFFLKSMLGVSEDDINTASFIAAEALVTEEMGFTVDENSLSTKFPTFRQVFERLAASAMLKIYKDSSDKWSILRVGQIGTATFTVTAADIVDGSFSVAYDYRDIYTSINVNYKARDVNSAYTYSGSADYLTHSDSNTTAYYDGGKNRQFTITTYCCDSTSATTIGDKYLAALSKRRGIVRMTLSPDFWDLDIGDYVKVIFDGLPGYTFTEGKERERTYAVISVRKSDSGVQVTLDDQLGIEDSTGVF